MLYILNVYKNGLSQISDKVFIIFTIVFSYRSHHNRFGAFYTSKFLLKNYGENCKIALVYVLAPDV